MPDAENGLPVEVAAALARVPTCGWHHGQYPDLCWWCGLNRVRVLPSGRGAFYEDHERDMQDPEYREAFEQATRDFPPASGDPQ